MPAALRQRDWDFIRRYLDMEERANGLPELGTLEPGKVDHPILAEWLYRGSAQPIPPQGIGYVAERLWQRENLLDGWSEFMDATIDGGVYDTFSLFQVHVNDELRRARHALGLMPSIEDFIAGHAQAIRVSDTTWEGLGLTVNAAPGGTAKHMDITRLPFVNAHPKSNAGDISLSPCEGAGEPADASPNLNEDARWIDDDFVLQWENMNAITSIIHAVFNPVPNCYPFNNTSWCPDGDIRWSWPTPDGWPLASVGDGPPPFIFGPGATPNIFPEWGWPLTISAELGNTDPFAPFLESLSALTPWTSCKDGASSLLGWSENSPADPGFDNVLEQIADGFLDDYPALLEFYFANVGFAASGSPSFEGDWMTLTLGALWGGQAQIMVRYGVAHLRGTVARGAGGGGSGQFATITNDPAESTSNQAVYDRWGPIAPIGRHRFPIREGAGCRALEVRHNQEFGNDITTLGTQSGGAQTLVLDGISWPIAVDTPGFAP